MKRLSTGLLRFTGAACLLCLIFHQVLFDLFRYSLGSNLYSHVLLVPFVSGWFVWQRRESLAIVLHGPLESNAGLWRQLLAPGMVLLLLVGLWVTIDPLQFGVLLNRNDHLSLMVFIFVTCLLLLHVLTLGRACFRASLFPLLFLYFMMPIPGWLLHWINVALQHATAFVLAGLLKLTGTPTFWNGLTFHLPGLTMEVAEECSGIRSTLVLLITALVGAMLFLRKPWKRSVLVASFFPIAALRNAARITTIAMLTIHVDPSYFHGPVHKQGGPPFFVLSLLPLFAIMIILRRGEHMGRGVDEAEGARDE
ncbi:MAG: archaeosortase/exosortase family protein [Kiritimatiellae bacterium]|nr:archaeosortase/exosortase family protein [Kiritimatiellia bacterium]